MADVRTVLAQAQAGSGNQDVTISGFGTPTFAMIYATDATGLNSTNLDASLCQGMYDGSNVGCVFASNEDNVSNSDGHNGHSSTQFVVVADPGNGTALRDASVSFITDGIRLNWAQSGSQFRLHIVLVTGTSAFVANVTPGTGPGNTAQITPGFQTKLAFTGNNKESSSDGTNERLSLGVFHYDGAITQRVTCITEQNNVADPNPRQRLLTNRAGLDLNNVSGAINGEIEVTAVSSTQVTFTTRTDDFDGGAFLVGCLEFADEDVQIGSIDSPTSAAADFTGPSLGFQPQAFGLIMTRLTSEDALVSGDDAGLLGVYAADVDGGEGSAVYCKEDVDGVTNTNTSSRVNDKLHALDADGTTTAFDMSAPDFNADDFEFIAANINSVLGTVRKWIYWAVEDAGGVTGTGTPASQDSAVAGVGERIITGSGTPASQDSAVVGVGALEIVGTGVLAAQDSAASGAGVRLATVTVELTVANARELRTAQGALVASLNNIEWEWYDDPDSTAGDPIDTGTFNTDAGGEATVTVTGTGLANGEFGQLILYHPSDNNIRAILRVPVTD